MASSPSTRVGLTTALVGLALALPCSVPAEAEASSADEAPAERAGLTGGWRGLRDRLEAAGLRPFATYTAGSWANVAGGVETGARYEAFVHWGVDADLGRLAAWPAAGLHLSWISYHGGQPSTDLVGSSEFALVSGWEGEPTVRFYDLYLTQGLLDGALTIKLGQMAADDDFFISRYASLYLNATFGDLASVAAPFDGPIYPLAAPGAYLAFRHGGWFARAGAYTGDAGEDESDNFGFDWSFSASAGAALFGELGRRWQAGLPGALTAGGLGSTGDRTDFRSGRRVDGTGALYVMLDQALAADARGNPRLGTFFRVGFSLLEKRSIAQLVVDGGINLVGPLPGRKHDVVGAAVALRDFSDAYLASVRSGGDDVSGHEAVIELTYSAALTTWLTLQPDLQIFLDPHVARNDAVVLGFRAILTL